VSESRMLGRIFGPKMDELTGGCRKLQNEVKLHNLYFSPNIIMMIRSRMMGNVVRVEMINAYGILFGEPEGKRPPRRPRRRWKNNTKINFREI
jgi:hypothetical protein